MNKIFVYSLYELAHPMINQCATFCIPISTLLASDTRLIAQWAHVNVTDFMVRYDSDRDKIGKP